MGKKNKRASVSGETLSQPVASISGDYPYYLIPLCGDGVVLGLQTYICLINSMTRGTPLQPVASVSGETLSQPVASISGDYPYYLIPLCGDGVVLGLQTYICLINSMTRGTPLQPVASISIDK